MRLSVALKYLRRTRAGIGYRRDFPLGLRAVLGKTPSRSPLGGLRRKPLETGTQRIRFMRDWYGMRRGRLCLRRHRG